MSEMRDYLEERERKLEARVKELEGDLSVARLQLLRIEEQVIGYREEVDIKELRRSLANIAFVLHGKL